MSTADQKYKKKLKDSGLVPVQIYRDKDDQKTIDYVRSYDQRKPRNKGLTDEP